MLRGTIRRVVAISLLTSLASTGVGALSAGGDQFDPGVISGHVVECDPVPVVGDTGFPAPTPTPSSVILVHHHVAYASQAIDFPAKEPWVGAFSFSVPPGRYEVISTYQGYIRWVFVRPDSSVDVTLGSAICPE